MSLLLLLRSQAVADATVVADIQPIHGYSFENDRRLLKARRDKEAHDKLSFAEQLEAIKPQIITATKTDHQAARDFVERITALMPQVQTAAISTAGYPKLKPRQIENHGDNGDDEAIALIIAALI